MDTMAILQASIANQGADDGSPIPFSDPGNPVIYLGAPNKLQLTLQYLVNQDVTLANPASFDLAFNGLLTDADVRQIKVDAPTGWSVGLSPLLGPTRIRFTPASIPIAGGGDDTANRFAFVLRHVTSSATRGKDGALALVPANVPGLLPQDVCPITAFLHDLPGKPPLDLACAFDPEPSHVVYPGQRQTLYFYAQRETSSDPLYAIFPPNAKKGALSDSVLGISFDEGDGPNQIALGTEVKAFKLDLGAEMPNPKLFDWKPISVGTKTRWEIRQVKQSDTPNDPKQPPFLGPAPYNRIFFEMTGVTPNPVPGRVNMYVDYKNFAVSDGLVVTSVRKKAVPVIKQFDLIKNSGPLLLSANTDSQLTVEWVVDGLERTDDPRPVAVMLYASDADTVVTATRDGGASQAGQQSISLPIRYNGGANRLLKLRAVDAYGYVVEQTLTLQTVQRPAQVTFSVDPASLQYWKSGTYPVARYTVAEVDALLINGLPALARCPDDGFRVRSFAPPVSPTPSTVYDFDVEAFQGGKRVFGPQRYTYATVGDLVGATFETEVRQITAIRADWSAFPVYVRERLSFGPNSGPGPICQVALELSRVDGVQDPGIPNVFYYGFYATVGPNAQVGMPSSEGNFMRISASGTALYAPGGKGGTLRRVGGGTQYFLYGDPDSGTPWLYLQWPDIPK